MKYYVGIDLGGTNIVAGVVDESYKIIAKAKLPTNRPRPAEDIILDCAEAVRQAVKNAGLTMDDIEAVGLGSPGTIDSERGVVVYSNNLDFEDVPAEISLSASLASGSMPKTTPTLRHTANLLPEVQRAFAMQSASPWEQA